MNNIWNTFAWEPRASHAMVIAGTFELDDRRVFVVKNSYNYPESYLLWDETALKKLSYEQDTDQIFCDIYNANEQA